MSREVKIRAVLNGFVADVGCQTLVFATCEELLSELRAYLQEPEKVEKHYREKAVNRRLLSNLAERAETARDQCGLTGNTIPASAVERRY